MESQNHTRIKVKTVGYYHRNKEMKITPGLLPKKLNYNKKYIDNFRESEQCPIIPLDIPVEDSGAGEYYMESLLEYIRLNPWKKEDKPDFVTNKNLLKIIASKDYEQIEVHAVRMNGVIFLVKKSFERDMRPNFGAVFEHFLTKQTDGEEISTEGIVRKAVFIANVPRTKEKERGFKVMYSGEIDAIDDKNNHIELKLTWHGMSFIFWEKHSCGLYWQSVFSNVATAVIGSRTGDTNDKWTQAPLNYPKFSLFEIRSLETKDIPDELQAAVNHPKNSFYKEVPYPRKPNWSVEESEKMIQGFFAMIHDYVQKDGDCITFFKTEKEGAWRAKHDEETIAPIVKLVKKCLSEGDVLNAGLTTKNESVEPKEAEKKELSEHDKMVRSIIYRISHPSETPPFISSTAATPFVASNPLNANVSTEQKSTKAPVKPSPELVPSKTFEPPNKFKSKIDIDLDQVPGMLQTQPKSKIVFNSPFDEKLTNRVKITNPTDLRIGFEVRIKSSSTDGRISVFPKFGTISSRDTVALTVFCEPFELEDAPLKDAISIEWINISSNEEFKLEMLEGDGIFRRKTLKIEYND